MPRLVDYQMTHYFCHQIEILKNRIGARYILFRKVRNGFDPLLSFLCAFVAFVFRRGNPNVLTFSRSLFFSSFVCFKFSFLALHRSKFDLQSGKQHFFITAKLLNTHLTSPHFLCFFSSSPSSSFMFGVIDHFKI